MGQDKALLPFRGSTLAAFAAGKVAAAAGSATFIGDPQVYGTLGFPVIADECPGEGPLGGILTALAQTNADWNLITACDMPQLTEGFLRELLNAAEPSDGDVLIPTNPETGRPEPLCAVYRCSALPVLQTAFAAGIRKITAAVASGSPRQLRQVPFVVKDAACFQNVNTPEEWAAHDQ